MRRRVVTVAVLAAILATTLFGLPLAYGVSQYFLADERNELERVADVAAISVTFDLAAGKSPPGLVTPRGDITVGFYDATGARPRRRSGLQRGRRRGGAGRGRPGQPRAAGRRGDPHRQRLLRRAAAHRR